MEIQRERERGKVSVQAKGVQRNIDLTHSLCAFVCVYVFVGLTFSVHNLSLLLYMCT